MSNLSLSLVLVGNLVFGTQSSILDRINMNKTRTDLPKLATAYNERWMGIVLRFADEEKCKDCKLPKEEINEHKIIIKRLRRHSMAKNVSEFLKDLRLLCLSDNGRREAGRFIGVLLADSDLETRILATTCLPMASNHAEEYIPLLFSNLQRHQGNALRIASIKAIEQIGCQDAEFLGNFDSLLADGNDDIRAAAVRLIGCFGKMAIKSAGKISKLAKDQEPDVALSAAIALRKVTGRKEAAVRMVRAILSSRNRRCLAAALSEIPNLGCEAEEFIPELVKVCEYGTHIHKFLACKTFHKLGEKALPAMPAVRMLLDDEDLFVRDAARAVLLKIENKTPRQGRKSKGDGLRFKKKSQ